MATTAGLNAVIDPSLEAQRESEVRNANQFTAGLERGARGLAATAIGAGEALTSALGLERTQAALKEVGDEQAALAQQAPVRVSRVEDIGSVEDAVDWAVAGLGQVAPSVVASLAGGAVGGAITRAVAGGASRFAVTAGQAAGAGTVGTTLGTGEAFREIQEETGVEAPGKSLATGAVLGALDVAGLGSGLRAARAVGRAAVGGTRQGVGRKLLAAPLVEGTTEAAQEATLIGARASEDEDFDLEQEAPELRSRLLNSFALGALAGGAFAAPGAVSEGAGRLRERLAAQDPDVAAQFDRELAKARGTGAAMRGKSLLDEGDQETLGEVLSFMEQRGIDDIPVELPGQGEVSAEQFEAGRGEGTSISLSSMLLALRQEQGNFRALEPRLQQAYTQLWSKLSPEGQQQFLEATTAMGVLGQDEAAAAPAEAPQAEEDPLDTAARLTSANERLGQALDQVLDPEGTALSQGVGRELGIEALTPLGQTREQGREIVAQLAEGLSRGPIHEDNRRKIRTLVQQGKVSAASPEVRQVLGDGTIRPKTTSDLGPDVLMFDEAGLAEDEELDGDFGMLFDLTQDADSDALLTFEERTQQMQVIGEDDPQLLEVLPNMNISEAGRITIPKAPNKLEAGLLFSAPDEETGAHRPSSLREKVDTLNASDPAHVYSVSNLYDVERLQARRSGVADLEQHIVGRARTTQQLLGRPTEVEDPETGEITATEGDPLRGQPIEDFEQAQAFLRNFGRLVRAPVQGLGRVGTERFTLEQLTGKVMATELARLRLSEQQSLLEDEQRALSAAAEDPRTGEPISNEEQGARLRELTTQITQVKKNKTVIGQGQEGRAILRKPKRSPVKQDKLRQELRAGTLSGPSREFVKQVLFKGVKQETYLRTGLKAEDWRRLVNEVVKPTRGTVTMVVQDEPFDVNIQSMISEANRGLPQGLNTEADLRRAYAEAASALTGVLTDRFLASAAEAQRKGYAWNEAEQTYALDSTLDGFQELVAQAEEEGAIWVDGLQAFEPAEGAGETAAKKFNNQLASEIARLNRIRNAVTVGAIPPQTVAFTRRLGENAFAQREYSAEELETVGTFDTKVAERAQIDRQIGRAELVLQYDTRAARRAQAKEGIELLETRGKALDAEIESLARRPGEGVEGRIGLLRDEGRELGLLYQPKRERLEEIRQGLVAQLEQHGLTDPQRAAPIKRQLDRLDTDRFIPQSVDAIPLARTYNERLEAFFTERVREDEAFDPREAERVAGQEEVSFEPVELDPIEAFPASGKEPEQAPSLAPAPIPEQAELRRGKGDQPTFGIEADLARLLDPEFFRERIEIKQAQRVVGSATVQILAQAKKPLSKAQEQTIRSADTLLTGMQATFDDVPRMKRLLARIQERMEDMPNADVLSRKAIGPVVTTYRFAGRMLDSRIRRAEGDVDTARQASLEEDARQSIGFMQRIAAGEESIDLGELGGSGTFTPAMVLSDAEKVFQRSGSNAVDPQLIEQGHRLIAQLDPDRPFLDTVVTKEKRLSTSAVSEQDFKPWEGPSTRQREIYERVTGLTWLDNMSAAKARGHAFTLRALTSRAYFDQTFADRNELGAELTAVENAREALRDGVAQVRHDAARAIDLKTPGKTEEERIKAAYKVVFGWSPNVRDAGDLNRLRTELKRAGEETGFQQPTPNSIWASIRRARLGGGRTSFRSDTNPFGLAYNEQQDAYVVDEKSLGFRAARQRANELGVVWEGAAKQFAASPDKSRDSNKILAQRKKAARQLNTSLKQELTRLNKQHRDLPRIRAELRERQEPRYLKRVEDAERTAMLKGRLLMNRIIQLSEEMPFSFWGDLTASSPGSFDLRTADWIETVKDPKDPEILAKIEQLREESAASKRAAAERKGAAGNVSPPTPQATARAGKTVWQSVVSASKSGTRKKAITQQIDQALGTLGPNFTKPTSLVYVNWEYADATQITDLVPEIKAEIENGTLWGYVFTDNDTGKHHVFVHPMLKDRKRLQTDVVAHEVGHLIFRSAAQQATAQEKTAIYNDYLKWVKDARDKKDVPEILKRRGIDPETVDQMLSKDYRKLSEAERQYLLDFEEFFADKVTRAAQPGDPKLHLKGASEPARTLYQRVAERMKAIFKHFTAANTVREFIQRVGTDQLPVPYVVGEGTMNKASEQPPVAKAVARELNDVAAPAENVQGFGDFPQEKVETVKAILAGLKVPDNMRLGFMLWDENQQVIPTEGMSPGQADLAASAHFHMQAMIAAGRDTSGTFARDTSNHPTDRLIVLRRDLDDADFNSSLLHELGHFITDDELSSASEATQEAVRQEYQTQVLDRVYDENGDLKNISFAEVLALTQPPAIVQRVLESFKERARANAGTAAEALSDQIEILGEVSIREIFGPDNQNSLVPTSTAWLETWLSYREYLAGQAAKWALTNERPASLVERFYASVAAAFEALYSAAARVLGSPNGSFEAWLNARWDGGAAVSVTPDGSEHNLREPATPAPRPEGTKAEKRAAAKHEKREQDKLKTAERIYRGTVQRKSDAAQKDAANRLRDLDPQSWHRAVLEAARAENTPDVFFRRLEEARKREEERRTEQDAYSRAKTQNRAEATGEAADAEAAALAGAGQAAAGGGDAALRGELLGREQEAAGPLAERGQTIESETVPPASTPLGGDGGGDGRVPPGERPFAEPGEGGDGERLRRILSQVLGQDARIRVDDFVELFLSKDPALNVLRPDEFSALGRAMMQPIVVRRLQEALRARGDERGLRLIDSQQNPILFVHYRMAHAYDLGFMEQAVQLGPQTSEIFGKVRGLFERVTGKQLFDSRANQVMQGLIANTIFRRAMGELDQFQLVTYKEATGKVNRTVQWVLRQLDALFDANGFGPILVGLSDRRLRATGNPFLIRIADLFHIPAGSEDQQNSFMAAKMKQTSHFLQILGDVYEGINPAEADEIGAILRKAKPLSGASNARVREAVTRTRELLRQMRTYTTNAGVALGDRGDDYFPMVFSVDKLLLERPAFIRLLNEEAFNAPMAELLKQAQQTDGDLTKDQLITQIYNRLVDNNGDDDTDISQIQGPPDDIFNPQFRFMNKRMLDFLLDDTPESLAHRETVNALLSHDHGTILSAYIHQGVKRAEFTRMFGPDGKVLRALMSQARKAGATDAQMRLVVNTIQAHQGNLGIGWNKNISKWTGQPSPRGEVINKTFNTAQSWLLVALNFAFLPMAVLSSLIDPIGIYARTGRMDVTLWGLKEGIANAMGNLGRNIDRAAARREGEDPDQVLVSRWDELAQAVGIADREVLLDALTSGYTSNQLPTKARKWNDAFFRWTGLEGWTRITRRMALASGTRMLEKIHTGQYVGFGDGMGREGRAKEAERRLRELNLDRELLARTWDEDTQTFQVLTSPERAELEQGTRTAEEQQRLDDDERLREGLRRFVDESVLHPNPAMRPVWMSNPWLAVPGYLKHYMFSFYDRIMRRMGYEITQDAARGSRTALVALTMYPAVMIAADAARHAIQGIDDDDRDDWTFADWMMYGTYRAGLLGPAGLAFEALQDREHGGVGYESALGPAAEFLLEDAPDLLSFYSEDASEAWLKVTPFSAVHRHWDLWDD